MSDQMEFKWMHFKLARWTATKNLWKFESLLLSYYQKAQINDKKGITKALRKRDYNNELEMDLMLHKPVLTTI